MDFENDGEVSELKDFFFRILTDYLDGDIKK